MQTNCKSNWYSFPLRHVLTFYKVLFKETCCIKVCIGMFKTFFMYSDTKTHTSMYMNNVHLIYECKGKGAHNRPGVAQRVPGGLGSQISWHLAHEGGEVVSLTHRPPLPPGMFLVLIFTRGWVDPKAMVRSEGICHWKIQWHHRESIPGPNIWMYLC